MPGLYVTLTSGQEHSKLRMNSSQIQVVEKDAARPYLKYIEDVSKEQARWHKGENYETKNNLLR